MSATAAPAARPTMLPNDRSKSPITSTTVNPDARINSGANALVEAARQGHLDSVLFLISGGRVDVNAESFGGARALNQAAENGHLEIVEYLVNLGADVNDQQNKAHLTPLHAAAERGFVEIAETLLSRDADVDLRAGQGHTPIKMATLNAHSEMVVLLRNHGGDCLDFGPGRFREYCLTAGN